MSNCQPPPDYIAINTTRFTWEGVDAELYVRPGFSSRSQPRKQYETQVILARHGNVCSGRVTTFAPWGQIEYDFMTTTNKSTPIKIE